MKDLLFEVDEKDLMRPTIEWMAERYNEMNEKLFGGKLGSCAFEVFTTGKGAGGRTLGWFCMSAKGLKYNKSSRRLYSANGYNLGYYTSQVFIDADNFDKICMPVIKMNGNYRWTEKAALTTLVHEMCHYYTFMNGFLPKQAHGPEFRSIAQYISTKSNGIFTIERLAKAEQMGEMVLDQEQQDAKDRRIANKKNKMIPTFVFMKDGEIRLVMASNMIVVNDVVNFERRQNRSTVKICKDNNLVEFLYSKGYRTACRKYRYWDIAQQPWIDEIYKYQMETVL